MELTWRDYAKRRTGLPVGSRGELQQNVTRAFQATSFGRFWQIWNPLFGYYLQKILYRPLQRICPKPLALWLTFVGNGLLHDLVTALARWDLACFFTPWFALMGLYVVAETKMAWQLSNVSGWLRLGYHTSLLASSAILAWQVRI